MKINNWFKPSPMLGGFVLFVNLSEGVDLPLVIFMLVFAGLLFTFFSDL